MKFKTDALDIRLVEESSMEDIFEPKSIRSPESKTAVCPIHGSFLHNSLYTPRCTHCQTEDKIKLDMFQDEFRILLEKYNANITAYESCSETELNIKVGLVSREFDYNEDINKNTI